MKFGNTQSKDLIVHRDERGHLFEVLRSDDHLFEGFGQVYVNYTLPGIVRGFHRHFKHSDIICCLVGSILLVTVDDVGNLEEQVISENEPRLIKIPPTIWHGFQGISKEAALTMSVVKYPFNPDTPDVEIVDAFDNPWSYQWRQL